MEDLRLQLQRIGLSPKQAEVYLLLLANGDLRIQSITNLTKLPRSTVYECLKHLFVIGLAEEVVENSFKIIRAYPVEALKHNLDEQMVELLAQSDEVDRLSAMFADQLQPSDSLRTTVRYYKGRAGARQLLWNTLKTEDVVRVYSAWGRGSYVGLKFYENFVQESKIRDIREQVLINPSANALNSIRTYSDTPISRTVANQIRCLREDSISIKGETFIYDNIYAQVYLKNDEIDGFEIESSHFADSQRSIHKTLWKMAQPVKDYL